MNALLTFYSFMTKLIYYSKISSLSIVHLKTSNIELVVFLISKLEIFKLFWKWRTIPLKGQKTKFQVILHLLSDMFDKQQTVV